MVNGKYKGGIAMAKKKKLEREAGSFQCLSCSTICDGSKLVEGTEGHEHKPVWVCPVCGYLVKKLTDEPLGQISWLHQDDCKAHDDED